MARPKGCYPSDLVRGYDAPAPLSQTFGADLLNTARNKAFDPTLFNYLCHTAERRLAEAAADGQPDCYVPIPESFLKTFNTEFQMAVMAEALNKRYRPCGVLVTGCIGDTSSPFLTPADAAAEWEFKFSTATIDEDNIQGLKHVYPKSDVPSVKLD